MTERTFSDEEVQQEIYWICDTPDGKDKACVKVLRSLLSERQLLAAAVRDAALPRYGMQDWSNNNSAAIQLAEKVKA